jgi:hypothetical protein
MRFGQLCTLYPFLGNRTSKDLQLLGGIMCASSQFRWEMGLSSLNSCEQGGASHGSRAESSSCFARRTPTGRPKSARDRALAAHRRSP